VVSTESFCWQSDFLSGSGFLPSRVMRYICLHLNEEAIITSAKPIAKSKVSTQEVRQKKTPDPMRPSALRTAIFGLFFSFLFLVTPGYFLYRYFTISNYLFERYYEFPAAQLPANMRDASQFVSELHLRTILPGSNDSFYAGICCLDVGETQQAIHYLEAYLQSPSTSPNPKAFRDATQWFLAMAYLSERDCESARQLLGAVANDSSHHFHGKSKEIIARMD